MNTTEISTKYRYIFENGSWRELPFRIGDFVTVTNWGCCYDRYEKAYDMLYGSPEMTYYSSWEVRKNTDPNRRFMIDGLAEHSVFNETILFSIKDNENRHAVMGLDGIKPLKIYPLRPGENNRIKLKKVPA